MRKLLFMMSVILLSAMLSAATLNQGKVVTTDLQTQISKVEKSDYIKVNIVLKKQINSNNLMSNARLIVDKDSRRDFVVNELKTFSRNTQQNVLSELNTLSKSSGVKSINPLWISNVINCYATPAAIKELSKNKDIASIDYDETRKLISTQKDDLARIENKPETGAQIPEINYLSKSREITTNVTKVNADDAWSMGYTGDGVLVALIDTGVNYNHYDIRNRMWINSSYPNHGYDFASNDNDPMDDAGHGSHCAGTIAGDGSAGSQTGAAPGAKIMALKVLDSNGSGQESSVWNAIQFAIDHNADILSMSIGWRHTYNPDRKTWRNTMNNVLAAGIIASVAAGNDGGELSSYPLPDNVGTPGDCPAPWLHPDQTLTGGISSVLCVGATQIDDNIAYFSSRGPATWQNISTFNDYAYNPGMGLIRPDVVAPGYEIKSLKYSSNTAYTTMSGTSMATPLTAGVMALMLSKDHSLTPAQITQIMEENAVKLTSTKSNTYGAGRIDATAYLNAIGGSSQHAPSCSISSPTNNSTYNVGETINVNVNASDSDGSISTVKFYIDGSYKGQDSSQPYNYYWATSGLNSGNHSVKAIAIDNDGLEKSQEITVKLIAPISLPYSTDFSSTDGWTVQNENCDNKWTTSQTNKSGGNSPEIKLSWQSKNPSTTRFISPKFTTNGISSLEVDFKHFFDYYGSGVTIKVQSSSDLTNWTDENWVKVNPTGNIGPKTETVNIEHNMGGNTYIAWTIEGNLYQFDYWYIDNVNIKSSTGAVFNPPSNLNATVTTNSVALNWNSPSKSLTSYKIYRKKSTEQTFASIATTASTSYTNYDLAAGTYQYYVTALYSNPDGESAASNTKTITVDEQASANLEEGFENSTNIPADWTIYDQDGDGNKWTVYNSSTYAHSGNHFALVKYNSSGNHDWLITPQLNIAGNEKLNFWARSYKADYKESFKVYISTSTNSIGSFTSIGTITDVPAEWTSYQADLSSYANKNIYIAFECTSVDMYYLFLDDISIGKVTTGIEDFNTPNKNLLSNYPNPFNPTTTINYSIVKNANISISIYNAKGEFVKNLVNSFKEKGSHSVEFNGSMLNSGIYYSVLTTPTEKIVKKIVLIK